MTILLLVIITALIFEFINGFHDTANSIATVVSTKVLTPRLAIFLAVVTNLLGAVWGTAVAKTVASGLVEQSIVTQEVIISALLGGIIWNLITWKYGLPSSSSHALIGGLCGAAIANAQNDWSVIIWSQPSSVHWYEGKGILWKVIIPMVSSPLLGFFVGALFMSLLYIIFRNVRPRFINAFFGKFQIFSAAAMGFAHGTNDAQKIMGIIALAVVSAERSGIFDSLTPDLSFFNHMRPSTSDGVSIDLWIKIICAITMAAGTACGRWRIIKTLGHKMVKLQPVNGFAAETVSALILTATSHFGIPVSTTHNITASIMGVGAAKRWNSIRWTVVEKIIWAWIFTLPLSGIFAYVSLKILHGLYN